ncbi:probable LRR receptor-like serine/threonine-protein kinase At3g47570 [Carya illinoinensis]|uniref:probable LRR receptor-like serine/threonine-protein kinase At3g47570 n=1 Tax=Carya illinoinensis TaxID=32201 RepID=UPI001C721625|nr:probable LRR receptor-like serine/threonine-protein kinase At3g47570 [Carya illinoinensis]
MANPTSFIFLLSLMLLLLQSYLFSFANAEILNVTTDKSALLALKAHVSSKDPHHVLISNWSSHTPICTWVGVTCGSKHLRVRALNLSYMDLVGTIPPHIGNLSFLVSLSIENNSFHGSLPNELSRLYRLKFLSFRYNEFSGEIPPWMGLLNKLQLLFLDDNNFEGSIPQSLSNISSLQLIDLSYNQLSGSIPSSLFKMPTLQAISLCSNKLSGLITSLDFNASSLQYIHLGGNELSGGLPMFDHLPNLQFLSVSRNHFSGVLPEIGNLTMLRELFLYENNFEGTIASSSLFECKDLQKLDLRGNNFTGRILSNIGNLTMLAYLYLNNNNFEGDEDSMMQTMTLATLGYMAPEYGLGGVVSTRGDVYSYGILLIETFTRKKPTDDMFAEEMSLKRWVNEALPISTIDIVDSSLLENERCSIALEECISSILGLALDCCAESPEQRTNMKMVLATLKKIKTKSLRDVERTLT